MVTNNIQNVYQPSTNIYKYTTSFNLIIEEENYFIDNIHIKNIAIDNDYKNTNMPMIFATLSIDEDMIDKMVQNQDNGIMIVNIQRAIANSDMPDLFTDYINDKFIYFISADINKIKNHKEEEDDTPDDFEVVTIGLLCLDHVNKNKKAINGIINGNLSSAMFYLTKHIPIVIEPPVNNSNISNRFLPPLNSVSKSLEYLNSLNVFYSTPYRFFIDFDCAYLLSSSGKGVRKKGENINTVLLTIRDTFSEDAKLQGMRVDEAQSLYKIECDGIYCELADNHIPEKSFNKIAATGTSGNKIEGNLSSYNTKSVISNKTRSVRICNDNDGLVDNMIASFDTSAVQLLIQKTDLDSSVFTMNKEYIIKADEVYKTDKYNGVYILTRKRELYIREDDYFTVNTMLLFEKVSENIKK